MTLGHFSKGLIRPILGGQSGNGKQKGEKHKVPQNPKDLKDLKDFKDPQ